MRRSLREVASLVALLACAGCGGGDKAGVEADLKKPTSDVRASAQSMDADALQKRAEAFMEALKEKRAELEVVVEKMKTIPPAELLGTQGAQLTKDLGVLEKDLSAILDRFRIYVDQMKSKGLDVTKMQEALKK